MTAPKPANEDQRLAALRDLLILDTDPEERFDRITLFAKSEFDVPMAIISLVDEERQWFKSRVGLGVQETCRDVAFCSHAILGEDCLVIPDALLDHRFSDNPLVRGDPWIRFYAGAPLRLPSGFSVGSLCILDTRPRTIDHTDLAILCSLRDLVVEELVRREVP
ncbi:GAF domain-containing protein [Hydrogenophaga sp. IBVHS2]|uniref:GAF domain-containing protein n=1 Tax=Hydrogenophaga sp. IBVHS2 TaxID=1985170 RepID=UPI000A2D72DC|nr:GAF domain-containing protein [Hydrogenophaga sp. IBVHS2]OSZ67381.1 histidine kinase [Hydrogenophaga sp. IBVHS2]